MKTVTCEATGYRRGASWFAVDKVTKQPRVIGVSNARTLAEAVAEHRALPKDAQASKDAAVDDVKPVAKRAAARKKS